jgi:hypothetical protein
MRFKSFDCIRSFKQDVEKYDYVMFYSEIFLSRYQT